jgi:hypothetical protein
VIQLSDVRLADLCRRTGFTRPDLYTAVAAAVATSGGRPGYEHAVYPGPVAVYKGLWGVDLCEWPDALGLDLSDPWEAAQTALDLTHECSGWGWCPAVRTGAHARYLDRAVTASSMMPGNEPSHEPFGFYAGQRAPDHHLGRLAAVTTAMHDHATRRQ